jgi:hypothetical protein
MDVGLDTNELRPWCLDEVVARMAEKEKAREASPSPQAPHLR